MCTVPSAEQWRPWLDEHAGRLLLFARQQCRCAADAEDVLQEALVEAWQRVGSGGLPPLPLVFATIRRRAIDLSRRTDSRQRREDAVSRGDDSWFDANVGDAETARLLEEGVKALPMKYGEVVTLRIWGELTFGEIAAALKIPLFTAASRYRIGIVRLRKRLKGVMS